MSIGIRIIFNFIKQQNFPYCSGKKQKKCQHVNMLFKKRNNVFFSSTSFLPWIWQNPFLFDMNWQFFIGWEKAKWKVRFLESVKEISIRFWGANGPPRSQITTVFLQNMRRKLFLFIEKWENPHLTYSNVFLFQENGKQSFLRNEKTVVQSNFNWRNDKLNCELDGAIKMTINDLMIH